MTAKLENLLELSRLTAKNAAARVLGGEVSQYREVEHNFKRDVKIVADRKLESLIVSQLRLDTRFPILSEESGAIEGGDKHIGHGLAESRVYGLSG